MSQKSDTHHSDTDVALADPQLKHPSQYHVLILNDDYTPMEFVVHVLQKFFAMAQDEATRVMLTIHTKGKGICGTFVRDVAETHVARINQYARTHEYPLLSKLEIARSASGDEDQD